jgi:histidyl-tRNA synthetase
MKPRIAAVKGTREFYPEDMQLRTWLYETMRRVATSFGYQEYEAPFLEPLALYSAKSSAELVKEQAFVFADRGGDLITLRPELTPSLARMVAQRHHQLPFPLRWWSFGPMWRYERPQKGRSREFFQWNADLIGVVSPEGDAELVALAATFLQAVGLQPNDVQILVNNRRLVDQTLQALGVSVAQRPDVLRLIDHRDKLSADVWATYAQELGIPHKQREGIVAMVANEQLWQQSEELQRFFTAITAFGMQAYVRFAPQIVRGLDYYTGTVFEAWDRAGAFRALLGGGRYDNLVAEVGGDPLPGVGFALGDVVLTLVLKQLGRLPPLATRASAPLLVTIFDEASVLAAIQLATELRQAGIQVACYPRAEKLQKQLKYADRIGAPLVLIAGPDERARNVVTVRDLHAGIQHTVARVDLVPMIQQFLRSHHVKRD